MTDIAEIFSGQGSQKSEMFNEFLKSKDVDLRNAGEEVVAVLEKFGTDGRDIRDIYTNSGVPPAKINNTRNVQPGLVALSAMHHIVLQKKLGYEFHPRVASGLSLGVIPALFALGATSLDDTLYTALLRGEAMSIFKPDNFYVMTIRANEPVYARITNWTVLRGSNSRVSIRLFPEVVSISGYLANKAEVIKRLKNEMSATIVSPDEGDENYEDFCKKFYIPFHNSPEMRPSANSFRHALETYIRKKERATGQPVFNNLTDSLFVTNDGKVLTNGKEIRRYVEHPHIVNLCNFFATVWRVGRLADYSVGIGIELKRYSKRGYIKDFYDIIDPSSIGEVADRIKRMHERVLIPELTQRKLVPSYPVS